MQSIGCHSVFKKKEVPSFATAKMEQREHFAN